MKHYTVGIDVGGTNIKLGLVSRLASGILTRENIAVFAPWRAVHMSPVRLGRNSRQP